MPRNPQVLLHVGIKSSIVALDSASGAVVWETKLKGGSFVNIVLAGDRLFATNEGEVFCLDARNGAIVWHNPLKGFGRGLATMAMAGASSPSQASMTAEEERRREQQRAAAAAV